MALSTDKPYPGMHVRALLASRGVDVSRDEALSLAVDLLRLATLGALVFAAPGAGTRVGGAGAGSEARDAASGTEGPTVYNVGPSKSTGGQE